MTEVVDKWVGFEIAPENGEKAETTLCPFFFFLFSLVLGFFLAFCSGCRERRGEILVVLWVLWCFLRVCTVGQENREKVYCYFLLLEQHFVQCVKRWYDWVFDCFWLFFLYCFYAEGWSGKFNFLWFIEEVMGGGSMGEKREEGFVFSFVFSLFCLQASRFCATS